ncbi:MAG: hypothetical protein ACI83D_000772 [Planctomycetota bacterium]|jgi:hypothetical protein
MKKKYSFFLLLCLLGLFSCLKIKDEGSEYLTKNRTSWSVLCEETADGLERKSLSEIPVLIFDNSVGGVAGFRFIFSDGRTDELLFNPVDLCIYVDLKTEEISFQIPNYYSPAATLTEYNRTRITGPLSEMECLQNKFQYYYDLDVLDCVSLQTPVF